MVIPVVKLFWQDVAKVVWVEHHTLHPDIEAAISTGVSTRLTEREFMDHGGPTVLESLRGFRDRKNTGPSSIDVLPHRERKKFYKDSRVFVVRPVNEDVLRISFMVDAREDGRNSGHITEDVTTKDFREEPLDVLKKLSADQQQ